MSDNLLSKPMATNEDAHLGWMKVLWTAAEMLPHVKNREKWVKGINSKLKEVGITSRRDFINKYFHINNKIRGARLKTVKKSTLDFVLTLICIDISDDDTPSLTCLLVNLGHDWG